MTTEMSPSNEVSNGSVDLIVHDVLKPEECELSSKNLLSQFLEPEITTETKIRDLCQPDGSIYTVHLPDRMRYLPNGLLYDTAGLQVFDKMIKLENEYYPGPCEIALIKTHMAELTACIPDGASLIDLGCGNMVKTKMIVDYLTKIGRKGIKVYGVDMDGPYLRKVLTSLVNEESARNAPEELKVHYEGVLGMYEQSLEVLKKIKSPRVFLALGFGFGNMSRANLTKLLNMFREETMTMDDSFFIGFDKRNDPQTIARAYNDSVGVFKLRMKSVIDHLNKLLGNEVFPPENFKPLSGYNAVNGSNERYFESLKDQTLIIPPPYTGHPEESKEVFLKKGELIHLMKSMKYSQHEVHELASAAGIMLVNEWTDPKGMIRFCQFKKCEEEE